jgi:hypothetical protein
LKASLLPLDLLLPAWLDARVSRNQQTVFQLNGFAD